MYVCTCGVLGLASLCAWHPASFLLLCVGFLRTGDRDAHSSLFINLFVCKLEASLGFGGFCAYFLGIGARAVGFNPISL
jgi:hypothetical protein